MAGIKKSSAFKPRIIGAPCIRRRAVTTLFVVCAMLPGAAGICSAQNIWATKTDDTTNWAATEQTVFKKTDATTWHRFTILRSAEGAWQATLFPGLDFTGTGSPPGDVVLRKEEYQGDLLVEGTLKAASVRLSVYTPPVPGGSDERLMSVWDFQGGWGVPLAEHADAINRACDQALAQPAAPVSTAEQAKKNSTFVLKTGNSYLAKFKSGKTYYYPQVGTDPEVLQFTGDGSDLTYGQELKIKTNNTSSWKSSYRSYNFLGAYADGVYYWDASQPDKVTWTITSVDGKKTGEAVNFGDKIRLYNKSYKQYLYSKGTTTSTKSTADATTTWTIEKR